MCTRCVMVATVCLVDTDVFFLVGHWSLRMFMKTTVCWPTDIPSSLHQDFFKTLTQPLSHICLTQQTINANEYTLSLVHCNELQVPYVKAWLAMHCCLMISSSPKKSRAAITASGLCPKQTYTVFKDTSFVHKFFSVSN